MKPNFALDLSHEGIRLLHRTKSGWSLVGEVALDAPDMGAQLEVLRKTASSLESGGITCKVIIPNSQVLYTSLTAHGPDEAARRVQIRAGLDGLTPYKVEDLVFDWTAKGDLAQVAVVAQETLDEAEHFATEHRFNPVSIVAEPDSGQFPGEAFFGKARGAAAFLVPGNDVEPDSSVVKREAVPDLPVTDDLPDTGADLPEEDAGTVAKAAPDMAPEGMAGESGPAPQPDAEPVAAQPEAPQDRDPVPAARPAPAPAEPEARKPAAPKPALSPFPLTDGDVPAPKAPAVKAKAGIPAPDSSPVPAPAAPRTPPARPAKSQSPLSPFPMIGTDEPMTPVKAPEVKPAPKASAPAPAAEKPAQPPAPDVPKAEAPAPKAPPIAFTSQRKRDDSGAPRPLPALDEIMPEIGPAPRTADAPAASRLDRLFGGPANPATGASGPKPKSPVRGLGAGFDPSAPVPPPPAPKAEGKAGAFLSTVSSKLRRAAPTEPPAETKVEAKPETAPDAKSGAKPEVPAPATTEAKPGTLSGLAARLSARKPSAKTPEAAPAPAAPLPKPATPATSPVAPARPSIATATAKPGKSPALDEAEAMTVFGARKTQRTVGGKPRYLGLFLTLVLLLGLAVVALWSMFFLSDGTAGLFNPAPETEFAGTAPAEVGAAALTQGEEPAEEAGDAIAALDTLPAPALTTSTMSEEAAQARYAASGIWERAPDPPDEPRQGDTGDLYIASIDPEVTVEDAVALPTPRRSALVPEAPNPLPDPETRFELNADGLVVPTPDGALTPTGILVYAGRPELVPPVRPTPEGQPEAETATPPAEDGLPADAVRPRFRPEGLIEANERANLGGMSRTELAEITPRFRPEGLAATAVATASVDAATTEAIDAVLADIGTETDTGSVLAVKVSPLPNHRPEDFQTLVASARTTVPRAPAPTVSALPTSASVAEAATLTNAIKLKSINLLGIYGSSSSRRALVRLENGRYVKVEVGDKLDGGRVTSITASQLTYQKGNKAYVLEVIPLT